MTPENLERIRQRNDMRRALRQLSSPGPWFVRVFDDDHAMNMIVVSTTPDTGRQERWPSFDASTVIAATLVQEPRYAATADERWEENAHFIASCMNDSPEDDIDSLVMEIERILKVDQYSIGSDTYDASSPRKS